MNQLLVSLCAHPLTGFEPAIVELHEPVRAAGLSMQSSLRAIYRDAPELGRRFRELKQRQPLPNLRQPWAFVVLSRDFHPATQAFTCLMGDVIDSDQSVPEAWTVFEVPALTYAVFPVRPRHALGWPVAIAHAKDYAYRAWMPGSGFGPAGAVDDFEYHDERSTRRKDSQVDLYVAVRRLG